MATRSAAWWRANAAPFLAKPVDFDFLKQQLLQLPEAKAMDQQII